LRLVRNRHKLRAIENVAAYLFVVVRNEALRFGSRNAKGGSVRLNPGDLFLEAGGDDASRRELADLVAHALQSLSPIEREVVELKIYGGLTFREIAQITDVPLQTVATRYRSALVRLKPYLAGQMT
jgi:RNA polymerase sigma-70 factor, ECF subfamily